jgi:hypothetical protein
LAIWVAAFSAYLGSGTELDWPIPVAIFAPAFRQFLLFVGFPFREMTDEPDRDGTAPWQNRILTQSTRELLGLPPQPTKTSEIGR